MIHRFPEHHSHNNEIAAHRLQGSELKTEGLGGCIWFVGFFSRIFNSRGHFFVGAPLGVGGEEELREGREPPNTGYHRFGVSGSGFRVQGLGV